MTSACRPLTAWRHPAVVLCAVALLAPGPARADSCSTLIFGAPSAFPTGARTAPSAVAVGDFDKNGTLDLAVANAASSTLGILLGNGAGELGAAALSGTASSPADIVTGDIDRDGRLDLVVASGTASNQVHVHQGLAGGAFMTGIPFGVGVVPTRLALADFDRDGRLDLVVVSESSHRVRVFQGQGTLVFGATLADLDLSPGSSGPTAAVAGDFNRDGNLDLAVALRAAGQVAIFVGNGTGALGAGATVAVGTSPRDISAGHVDRDGRLDLVTANDGSGNVSVLKGTGAGGFAPQTAVAGLGQPSRVALADLDRDGVVDLVVLDLAAPRLVTFRGNPASPSLFGTTPYPAPLPASSAPQGLVTGDFTSDGRADLVTMLSATNQAVVVKGDSGSTCVQSSFDAARSFAAGDGPVAVAAADFDEDGRADLVAAAGTGSAISFLKGTPAGYGPPVGYLVSPAPRGVATADFNFDGHADVVAALGTVGSGKVQVYLGDGTGLLVAGFSANVGNDLAAVAVGEFNGDGAPDVAVASEATDEVLVLLGNGAGGFGAPISTPVGIAPRAIVTGDFDGVGLKDLAVACSGSNAVWVLLANGSGTFTVGPTPAVGTEPWGIAAADLDGDTRTDIVTANHGANTVSVLKGTGTGTFAAADSYAVDAFPTGVALLGVDNTTRPDIVVSTASIHTVNILLDDGSGGFTFTLPDGRIPVRSSPQAVVPVDVDRDGRLDVVVPCRTSDAVVVLVTRPPSFQGAPRVAVGSQPQGATAADLDGDGDLDLAVANTAGNSVSLLANNGSGTFTALAGSPLTLAAGAAPTAVVSADFDRDGILDLAVTDAGAGGVSVLRGLGGGAYAGYVSFLAGSQPDDVASADVNRDGRVDLLVSNEVAGTVTLLRNTTTVVGSITFAAPSGPDILAVGEKPTALFVADFNHDGWLDFAVSDDRNTAADRLTVRYADGLGSFSGPVTLPLSVGDNPLSVTGADFDGDGDIDLATAAFFTDTICIFENLGGSFSTTPIRIPAPDVTVFATAADLNRDGRSDLAVAAMSLKVLRGKGSLALANPFEDGEDFLAGLSPAFVVVADWNRDGWPDAAVVNGGSSDVSIFLSSACAARRLEVTLQPAACVTTPPFLLQAQVTARDEGGNLAACVVGTVTPAIVPGTGELGAVLGGPGPQPLLGGEAAFVNLSIDRPGRRYRLQFSLAGVPSVESRSFTLGAQLALLGPTSICPSTSGTYQTEGSYDEYVWSLSPPGAPFAYRPSVILQNPPLGGAYTLGVSTRVDGCSASASLNLYAGDLQSTSLAIQGVSSVCVDCIGGTLKPTDIGGGPPLSRQWGYRTTSGAAVPVSMPGETGETYTLKGANFPGPGTYWVVVTTQPTCGAPPTVSSEIPVTVIASVPTGEIQYLGAAARGSTALGGQVELQWVNSTGTADEIRVRWNKAPNGTGVCVSPPDTVSAATGETPILSPPSATKGGQLHTGLVFDTAYCYSVFVKVGTVWSPGRTVKARPFNSETGPVKWAYSTGGTAVVPPVVGKHGLVAMSNDRTVHALTRGGVSGGVWPADWVPQPLAGVAHSRSPIVPFATSVLVTAGESVLFVGDDSGDVRAFNARTGQSLWTPPNLGKPVIGAPGGLFQQYNGTRDLVIVGTRDGSGPNALHGLNLADGLPAGTPFVAGNNIGAISGTPAIDYSVTPNRVYFASRSLGGPTIWCVEVDASTPFTTCSGWTSRDLGDIDGSPVLRNGRVYVGNTAGTVYSLDAATGLDERTFSTGDGPVKGFLFPDRRNDDLMFATNTRVWSISDDGSPSMSPNWQWTVGGLVPSVILYWPQNPYVYVGSKDGKLYELDFSLANPLPPTSKPPLVLGDGLGQIGAPTLDIGVVPPDVSAGKKLLVVGSESGVLYGVEVPLP